jgi:hypothetical protein
MIDANSTIVFKGPSEIIPEGELSPKIRMQRPKCVDVAEFQKISILGTWLRLKKCITYPGGRLVAIDIFWDDIEVTTYQGRRIFLFPNL